MIFRPLRFDTSPPSGEEELESNVDLLLETSGTLLAIMHLDDKWGFPNLGVPLNHHPLLDGIFRYEPSSYFRLPHLWKQPLELDENRRSETSRYGCPCAIG